MEIQILAVEFNTVNEANSDHADSNACRYSIEFRSQLVDGKAFFVPYGPKSEPPEVGAFHSVETGFEKISGFRLRKPNTKTSISSSTLGRDYDVVATVAMAADDGVLEVVVGNFRKSDTSDLVVPKTSFPLTLDCQDTQGAIAQSSDKVSFQLHGLSLFDQGV